MVPYSSCFRSLITFSSMTYSSYVCLRIDHDLFSSIYTATHASRRLTPLASVQEALSPEPAWIISSQHQTVSYANNTTPTLRSASFHLKKNQRYVLQKTKISRWLLTLSKPSSRRAQSSRKISETRSKLLTSSPISRSIPCSIQLISISPCELHSVDRDAFIIPSMSVQVFLLGYEEFYWVDHVG